MIPIGRIPSRERKRDREWRAEENFDRRMEDIEEQEDRRVRSVMSKIDACGRQVYAVQRS